MKKAFSCARFSSSEQMDGRSLARQEEAKAYCARHGLKPDGRTFRDLAEFLEPVKDGRIRHGNA